MRRRGWWIAAAGVAGSVAVIAALFITKPPAQASNDREAPAAETAEVSRGDLSEQVKVSGKLAYGDAWDLGTTLPGMVTEVPPVGSIVGRGEQLFRVDNSPIILMLGRLPAWREFAEGMADGPDIRQLEENLAAQGFFDGTPDEEFTWSTISAITAWQKALGLEKTGRIESGRIVFAPAAVRIQEVVDGVGSPASGAVLKVTRTTKEAIIDLKPNLAALAPVGASVEVQLPNGSVAVGTITAVGSPVERDNDTGGKSLRIPVTLVLDDPTAAESFDTVTVNVTLTNVIAEDVLLVPVTALLVKSGGGSAVERVAQGKSTMVPVELGKFAAGMVEILDGDLAEGDAVVVAQ